MSISLAAIDTYLDALLKSACFQDYAPNGVQVEGKRAISHIVTGVTACQALIDAAIVADADLILVHHGYFWKGEDPCLLGIKRQRLASLLANDLHLLAYHLPLDAHPELGNNAQLAKHMGWQYDKTPEKLTDLIWYGRLEKPTDPGLFNQQLTERLGRAPLHMLGKAAQIESIAWCTGAAQDYFETAILQGVDAFITGEVSERTWHIAREYGVHFFAAGHHATERYGIQALGEHLAAKFAIKHQFIDIPNPI